METASRQLCAKFDVTRDLLGAPLLAKLAGGLGKELAALEARFALSTGHLFIGATAGESGRLAANAEFSRVLAVENFSGAIDRLVDRAEGVLRGAGIALRDRNGDPPKRSQRGAAPAETQRLVEIQRLLDIYPRGGGEGRAPAAGAVQQVDYERCPSCGGDMAVDAGRSELRCGEVGCGTIRELVGTVFDDSQFYSQEGQKAKSGTFNPNRHFQFWWTRILAREPEEEIGDRDNPDNTHGEKLLAALRKIVARDRKVLRLLTVNDVRTMLRETGNTNLNKNVPLLLKKLTGIGPPQIVDSIAVRVENLFSKAIEIGERVQRSGRVNRNYYPYYIYKILDRLLPDSDVENRRVLYYIYIQSRETVEADDADWEQICIELGEIAYVPTDRTMALKYRPI